MSGPDWWRVGHWMFVALLVVAAVLIAAGIVGELAELAGPLFETKET